MGDGEALAGLGGIVTVDGETMVGDGETLTGDGETTAGVGETLTGAIETLTGAERVVSEHPARTAVPRASTQWINMQPRIALF